MGTECAKALGQEEADKHLEGGESEEAESRESAELRVPPTNPHSFYFKNHGRESRSELFSIFLITEK